MTKFSCLFLALTPLLCEAQTITTVAGANIQGYLGDGGPAISASLSNPEGVVVDSAGNVYFADKGNYAVREVNVGGIINTVAGPGSLIFGAPIGDGGPATSANFGWTNSLFVGLAMDAAGNLYISDSDHGRVRRINTSGIISTVAGSGTPGSGGDGGPATSASLFAPAGIVLDKAGNLCIADPSVGCERWTPPETSAQWQAPEPSVTPETVAKPPAHRSCHPSAWQSTLKGT